MQYVQKYMEEQFNTSSQLIQSYIEMHGSEIWNNFKNEVNATLKLAGCAQSEDQKGAIQYLAFSFLRCGLYQDRLELRIEVFDDSFYLDEKETAGSYYPTFLQERYSEDLSWLYKEAGRKFVRMQEHELFWIKEQYSHYYEAVIYRMIENLSGLLMREVEESSVSVTDDFKLIYGEFMDRAVVLYAKEKEEDEILSD